MRVNSEKDFHGFTSTEMLGWLNQVWASHKWDGLQRIRIIHGKGEILIPALRKWCDEKGIPWAPEPGNPGATILHPALHSHQKSAMRNTPLAKPLAPLRKHSVTNKGVSRQRSAPDQPSEANDTELFEEELRKLGKRG